jgi:hypothetical protein
MNPPPPRWVPFVAAVATLTAALVALFKEDIVKIWRRPDLTMRIKLTSPDCVRMPVVVRYTEAMTRTSIGVPSAPGHQSISS